MSTVERDGETVRRIKLWILREWSSMLEPGWVGARMHAETGRCDTQSK